MKALLAALLSAMMLLGATDGLAKVCYRCRGDKPVKYVCSNADTFKARKNARKLGCNWSSYSSSCKCGAWVSAKSTARFFDYALSLFPEEAAPQH
jgi:hypothetical protein